MERLKSAVPDGLRQGISASSADDLPATSLSLLNFFNRIPLFHQFVKDLTDPEMALCRKDPNVASDLKVRGNKCFSSGDHRKALDLYTQALRFAPTSDDREKTLAATLYVNRASALHKMGLVQECLQDCGRAIVISPTYAKAWFRRGKANASLRKYEEAIQDLNVSLKMEGSLSGKRQIEGELEIILDQHKLMHSSSDMSKQNESDARPYVTDEADQANVECVPFSTKGRGMVSRTDIHLASLVHKEDPYAAIILKTYRETNCHFCFIELPANAIPCDFCSIPLYCSRRCQLVSGGKVFCKTPRKASCHEGIPDELEKYISQCISGFSAGNPDRCTDHIPEHRHECQGAHWPSVLPSDVVLAGRVIVKFIEQQKHSCGVSNLIAVLDLCHNYVHLPPETKLELHIYSIVLLNCLQNSYALKLPMTGMIISQVVILLSQIRVNSMAIARMKSFDMKGLSDVHGNALTSIVEQVKVGQAIYLEGSMFNHSCRPNAHAYFLSRTLYVRTTETVAAGSELEISYGPQVGQWDYKDRQKILREHYSFDCQCRGCSQLNLSDLSINAYKCAKQDCEGVVLDCTLANYVKQKVDPISRVLSIPYTQKQVEKGGHDGIIGAAKYTVHKPDYHLNPQHCLNCGSYCDLEAASAAISKAQSCLRRLQDAISSSNVPAEVLSNALKVSNLLRSTLHPCNKRIAEVEDNIAQAMCLVGDPRAAVDHCIVSIKILEKLYDPNHIVIGYELVKLGTIQMQLGDCNAAITIKRASDIFSWHFGSYLDIIFPYLQHVRLEADSLLL
ncbi:hypothetical protein DM860_016118 [Cuscuta australis]|uniref:SET domain-containing protein n=1 Tax=Cuscuta australis TaxID=267555 RepID=A0A328E6L3_9ASTE|nr:hypothetical protein DM860_016118 [Cuscuta australis]